MATILLETINPADLTPDDLEELASVLTEQLPGFDYEIASEEQHGAGVTWHEVLRVWLPDVTSLKDDAYGALLGTCFAYMRSRFARKHGSRRPKSIILHDESGREIASYTITKSTGEPQEKEPDKKVRKRPRGRHRK